ncbi:hypothetical protein [Pseudarthrobacter sp. H2]|uniref:hypothetical protein n=1 Tax=Pseudarthrobacter sp. H2 TaxID=3418415 RepID=UPI003CFAA7F8
MSEFMAGVLVVLFIVGLVAMAAVVSVLRDGRGTPPEPSDQPWTARELPSSPYYVSHP